MTPAVAPRFTLRPGIGVRHETGQVGDPFLASGDEGMLDGVEDEVGGHRSRRPPATGGLSI